MTLPLISNVILAIILVVGLLNGLRRGGIKEGAALIGVLLGALLVEYWSEPWSQTLTQFSQIRPELARWLVALMLLLGTAVLSGYGGSTMLRRGKINGSERGAGALIGLLNASLLVAFALRYTQQFYFNEIDPTQPVESWIRQGPLSRYMLDLFGLVLLGAAAMLAIAALLTLAVRLGRMATRPAPAPQKPAPAAKPKPTTPSPAPVAPAAKPVDPMLNSLLNQANKPPQDLPPGKQEKFLE